MHQYTTQCICTSLPMQNCCVANTCDLEKKVLKECGTVCEEVLVTGIVLILLFVC